MLAELGGKLRSIFNNLTTSTASTTIDEAELNQLLSELSRALIEADVNVKLVMTVRTNIKQKVLSSNTEKDMRKYVKQCVMDELIQLVSPVNTKTYKIKKNKPNVILFVGLQGSGKTTTIAKYANYYQRRGYKTAMVCADTFRAGAFDQLKQNATKLRIPFYGSYTQADPVAVAEEGVAQFKKLNYEVIIVDTSGRHAQESALFEEMQEISSAISENLTILVMDATQGQALLDQALAFHAAVDVGSIIITKLDGHAKGGGALAAVAKTQSPILFLGHGEHFDDLESFNGQSFISKLLGYGDVRGFMEHMKMVTQPENKKDLVEKFSKGQFTLRDMYNQFSNFIKMGPMNKVMGMLPGMPDYLSQSGGGIDGNLRLKKFLYIMDSMTNKELDGKVSFSDFSNPETISRINRIAKGSGTHPNDVKVLLQTHEHFATVAQKVGKSGLMNQNTNNRMAEQLKRNPNQLMQQLQKNMDPKMMQQMGGANNMMNMMQQMAKMQKGGGMPDMNMMQQMMGGGMPGGGMPGGMGGMDMNAMAQMMQQMGGGGMPGMMPNARR